MDALNLPKILKRAVLTQNPASYSDAINLFKISKRAVRNPQ